MRFATQAQYARSVHAFYKAPLADLNEATTVARLQQLHPSPPEAIVPPLRLELPLSSDITESMVRRAFLGMNTSAVPGPDRMTPRILHLLPNSTVCPEVGVAGLSTLTRLVRRLARGGLLRQTIPLVAVATLLPIQKKPDKIRPIAIDQSLRRLVTKVLLPAAIADTRGYLQPEQPANGAPDV